LKIIFVVVSCFHPQRRKNCQKWLDFNKAKPGRLDKRTTDKFSSVDLGNEYTRNQWGTPGAVNNFLTGAQTIKTISNTFTVRPTHFPGGGKKFNPS